METERERIPPLTLENFMADVPDMKTCEELCDLFGDHPMFSLESLAKAREMMERIMQGEARLPSDSEKVDE